MGVLHWQLNTRRNQRGCVARHVIKHHPTCRADYPEKPEDELPQQIVEIEGVRQCVDCGAYEVVRDASCLDSGCDIDGKEPHKPWCDHA